MGWKAEMLARTGDSWLPVIVGIVAAVALIVVIVAIVRMRRG